MEPPPCEEFTTSEPSRNATRVRPPGNTQVDLPVIANGRRSIWRGASLLPTSVGETDSFTIERLPNVQIGLVCRGRHPIFKKDPADLREVRNHPLVSYALSKSAARRLQAIIGYRDDPDRLLSVELENLDVLKQIVLNSDAVMLAPLAALLAETQTGRLRMLPTPAKMFTKYGLVQSAGRLPHPALNTLAQHARDHLEAIAI